MHVLILVYTLMKIRRGRLAKHLVLFYNYHGKKLCLPNTLSCERKVAFNRGSNRLPVILNWLVL